MSAGGSRRYGVEASSGIALGRLCCSMGMKKPALPGPCSLLACLKGSPGFYAPCIAALCELIALILLSL